MTTAQFWTTVSSEIKITPGGNGGGGRGKPEKEKGGGAGGDGGRGGGGGGGWSGRGNNGGGGGGPSLPEEYLQFLIDVTDNNGDTVVGMDEIQILDIEGNNLARTETILGPGTALGNSKVSYVDGYDGVYKNFGMNLAGDTDGWIDAETGQTGWTQMFFDAAHDMTSCTIMMQSPDRAFKDFTFQYSDNGSSWTTVRTVTGETWTGFFGDKEKNYSWTSAGAHRYWRINVTATSHGALGVGCYNIRWLNAAGQYIGPTERIVICTANTNFNDADRPYKLFAGPFPTPVPDTQTGWLSTTTTSVQLLRITFPYLVRVASMKFFVPKQSGNWQKNRMPKDFTIEGRKTNAGAYDTLYTAVGEINWLDNENREFVF